jgi:GPI transamidase subunit PIG-U
VCISGQSPYERSTYRYPPILALLVTPNFFLFPEWGKLLFSIADVGIVYLIYAIRNELDIKRQGIESASRSFHSDADSVCSEDNNDIELTFQHSSGDMGNTVGVGVGGFRSSDVTPPNGFSDSSSNSDNSSSNGNSKYDATAFSNIKVTSTSINSNSSSNMNMNGNNYSVSGSNNINNININDSSSSGGRGEGRTVAWFWALNPLAINICTRGSADAITNCMVLALLYLLMQQSKQSHLILFDLIPSNLIIILPCLILFYCILSYLILFYLISSLLFSFILFILFIIIYIIYLIETFLSLSTPILPQFKSNI